MKRTLAIFLVTLLCACNSDKDYGYVTPYSATVPAGWTDSSPIRDTGLALGENDDLWVPDIQPERVALSQALVFCSARPVKGAPSTHCEVRRIMGWNDPHARRSRPTTLCDNRQAEEIAAAGNFEGVPAVARAVRTVDTQGEVYLALYVRKLSQTENPAAAKSIRTICPFKNREDSAAAVNASAPAKEMASPPRPAIVTRSERAAAKATALPAS